MTEVFVGVLNMSLMASCMIVAVLLVRLVFRRVPRALFCLLWCLVGVRLIFPVSLESQFSLVPDIMVGWSSSAQIMSNQPQENGMIGNDSAEAGKPLATAENNSGAFVLWSEDDGKVTDLLSVSPTVINIAAIVWLVGAILLLGYGIVSYIWLKRRVMDAVCWKKPEEVVTNWKKNIYQSEKVMSPFVLGIFCPKIYVSYDMNQEELEHIIAHEQAHIRRGDHFLKPLSFGLLAVHWYNPLIWVWFVLLCRDMELACDERVMKDMNLEQRKTYAGILLECSTKRKTMMVYPLAFGETGVATRIKNALHYKKPAFWVVAFSLIICVVLAVGFLTTPVSQQKVEWPAKADGTPRYNGPAIKTEDGGFLTQEGKVYKYCHVLTGTFRNAVSESILLVYTNAKKVTFEQAANQLWSSSLVNYPEMSVFLYPYLEENKDIKEYNTSPHISLTLENVTPQGAKWKIQTDAGSGFDFGSEYFVERWINDGWYEQPTIFDNYAWNMVLYHAEGNRTEETTWTQYGNLPSGKYRFIKTIKQGGKEYPLVAEFEIY